MNKRKARANHNLIPRRRRRGMSVLQVILGLLMSIAIIVGILQLFNRGQNMVKNMQLTSQLTQITTTVDIVWQFRGDYPAGSMTETVINRGEFSGQSVQGTSPNRTIVSPYNTAVTVTGAGGRDYSISYADLPANACSTFLERYINETRAIDGASVEGTTLTIPVTDAQIDTRCAGQADNKYTVVVTY